MTRRSLLLALPFILAAFALPALAVDVPESWRPYAEESVVEILTRDEDGGARETKVWIVVVEQAGFVRTNDSQWLANIRRGSDVVLRARGTEVPVRAEEVSDTALKASVEAAFLEKYGTMQRVMSALRTREPTVLRLQHRSAP